jgi:hypothetical protein
LNFSENQITIDIRLARVEFGECGGPEHLSAFIAYQAASLLSCVAGSYGRSGGIFGLFGFDLFDGLFLVFV